MSKLIKDSDLTSSLLYVFYSSASGGGAQYLGDLLDVLLGTLNDSDILVYDSTSGMWVNKPITAFVSPAPPTYSLQWNDNGSFGGSADLIYDAPNNALRSNADVNAFGTLSTSFDSLSNIVLSQKDANKALLFGEITNTANASASKFITVSKDGWIGISGLSDTTWIPEVPIHIANNFPRFIVEYKTDTTIGKFIRFAAGTVGATLGYKEPGYLAIGGLDTYGASLNGNTVVWDYGNKWAIGYVAGYTPPSTPAQVTIKSSTTTSGATVFGVLGDDSTPLLTVHNTNSYVGIGTNSPTVNLHVVGVGQNWSGLIMEGTDYASIRTKTSAGDFMWSVIPTNKFVLYEWSTNRYLMAANTNMQFKIGQFSTTFEASAVFEVADTAEINGAHMGSLPSPRMDTNSRNLINSPACGLMIFNIDTNSYEYWSCTTNSWEVVGNTAVAPPDRAVQYNSNGVLGGSSNFIWDYTNNYAAILTQLLLGNDLPESPYETAKLRVYNKLDGTQDLLAVQSFSADTAKTDYVILDSKNYLGFSNSNTFYPQAPMHMSLSATTPTAILEYANGNPNYLKVQNLDGISKVQWSTYGSGAILFGAEDSYSLNINRGTLFYNRGAAVGVNVTVTDTTAPPALPAQFYISASTGFVRTFAIYKNDVPSIRLFSDSRFIVGSSSYEPTDTILLMDRQYSKDRVVLRADNEAWFSYWVWSAGFGYSLVAERYEGFHIMATLNSRKALMSFRYSGDAVRIQDDVGWSLTEPVITQGSINWTDSALFEVFSSTKGSLPAPRLTTAARNAIANPACGLLVYNTDIDRYQYYDCSLNAWVDLAPSPGSAAPPAGAVQYNDGNNNFAGDASLTWDDVNKVLNVTGKVSVASAGASSTYTPNSIALDTSTGVLGFQFGYVHAPFFLLDALTAVQRANANFITYIEPAFYGPADAPPDMSSYPKTIISPLTWTNTTYINLPTSYGLWTRMVRANSAYGSQDFNTDLSVFTISVAFHIGDTGAAGELWEIAYIYETGPKYVGLRINWDTTGGSLYLIGENGGTDTLFASNLSAGDIVIVTMKKASTSTTVYGLATIIKPDNTVAIGGADTNTNITGAADRTLFIGALNSSGFSSIDLINLWISDTYLGDNYLRYYHASMRHKFNR